MANDSEEKFGLVYYHRKNYYFHKIIAYVFLYYGFITRDRNVIIIGLGLYVLFNCLLYGYTTDGPCITKELVVIMVFIVIIFSCLQLLKFISII